MFVCIYVHIHTLCSRRAALGRVSPRLEKTAWLSSYQKRCRLTAVCQLVFYPGASYVCIHRYERPVGPPLHETLG